MKCISLWQPWASLLVHGAKRIETRSWPTPHRGPILIHAAKKWDSNLGLMCGGRVFKTALTDLGCKEIGTPHGIKSAFGLPLGAIIGKVTIAAVESTHTIKREALSAEELAFGDYMPGRFAWFCTDFIPFAEPIPYIGRQGMFDVPPEVLRQGD